MSKIYVVEGNHDYNKLKEVDKDLDILITNGAAIDDILLDKLERLSKDHDIVLFFDADNAGERLRRIISNRIPSASHAFIKRENSMSKNLKKVGVEHARVDVVKEAMAYTKVPKKNSDLTQTFLLDLGLMGDLESKRKRFFLCESLGIGYVNGKGLLKRLTLFGYQETDIVEVLNGFE